MSSEKLSETISPPLSWASRSLRLALVLGILFGMSPSFGQAPTGDPGNGNGSGTSEPSASEPGAAEPGQVTVELSPETVTVGGRVRAEITVVWMGESPKESIRFPTWQETWGGAEVIESSPVEAFEDQSGRHVAKQVLELTAFEAGDVNLPARTFAIPLESRTVDLSSEPSRFVIESVLPEEAEADPAAGAPAGAPAAPVDADQEATSLEPRGNAPLTSLEMNRTVFLVTVVALVLWLLAGLELLRRALAREEMSAESGEEERDAFSGLEPLAELLARLEQLDPVHGGAAHTGLSLALRRYLGRTLGFHAVESTTTEIQRKLLQPSGRTDLRAPVDLAQRSLELLRASDLVKFAGLEADPATVRGRVIEARELGQALEAFIEETRRPLVDPVGGEKASTEEAA